MMSKQTEILEYEKSENLDYFETAEAIEPEVELEKETIDEMKSGSELLVDSLVNEDVDFIFGYPGGAVLPLYDTFYDGKIKHILARHNKVLHTLLRVMRVFLEKLVSLSLQVVLEQQMQSLVLLMLIVIHYRLSLSQVKLQQLV